MAGALWGAHAPPNLSLNLISDRQNGLRRFVHRRHSHVHTPATWRLSTDQWADPQSWHRSGSHITHLQLTRPSLLGVCRGAWVWA